MQAQELTLHGNDASGSSQDCSKTPTPKAKGAAAKAANYHNKRL
jgi:hypothetical protein